MTETIPFGNSIRFRNWTFWSLLIGLLVYRLVILLVFNLNWVDNDQTLFWLIAKDYSHGIFHQPFVYGQDYNYAIEAIIAVPFLWCGVPVHIALPLVTHLLAIAPFLSFAFYYKRNGRLTAAVLVLTISLLLPNSYALITSMPRGFINGLALFAFWPWIEHIHNDRVRYALYGAVVAAAFAINPNVLFIAVLLTGMQYANSQNRSTAIVMFLCGASIPALLHVAALRWADQHADQILHFSWNLQWTADYFKQAFSPAQFFFFKGVVPLTEQYAAYAWFIFPALMGYAFYKRKYLLAFLMATICVGVIVSFGINKVNDGTSSVFFPLSRMFLALPLVLVVFVAELIGETNRSTFRFAAVLIAGVFLGINLQRVNASIEQEVNNHAIPLSVKSIGELQSQTAQLNSFAKSNSIFRFAGMGYPMAYGDFQIIFFAGAAWNDDFPTVALPEYERRKWESEKIMEISARHTVWFGGDEYVWDGMNPSANVEAFDILNLRGYRVNMELTHRQVLRYHGRSMVIGE